MIHDANEPNVVSTHPPGLTYLHTGARNLCAGRSSSEPADMAPIIAGCDLRRHGRPRVQRIAARRPWSRPQPKLDRERSAIRQEKNDESGGVDRGVLDELPQRVLQHGRLEPMSLKGRGPRERFFHIRLGLQCVGRTRAAISSVRGSTPTSSAANLRSLGARRRYLSTDLGS